MIPVRTNFALLALLLLLIISSLALGATEDIVHMDDGRELHGQIIKETDQSIVFDYLNPDLGVFVTLTLPKAKILRVERDIEVDGSPEPSQPAAGSTGDTSSPDSPGSSTSPAPVHEGSEDEIASFYIIPFHGDVGTDINASIYEDVIDEINTIRPDVVIFEIDSLFLADDMLSWWLGTSINEEGNWWEQDPTDRKEHVFYLIHEMEEIVTAFHYKLPPDIEQVVWTKNATGPAGILALCWEEMYMHPEGNFGTLGQLWAGTLWPDPDVRSKMQKASYGAVKALTGFGMHDPILVEGLLIPNSELSFSCRGREAIWYDHYLGDIPVHAEQGGFDNEIRQYIDPQSNLPMGLEFDARPCEELLISDGTAETLQDLAMLMGYREYRVEEAPELLAVAGYSEKWRAMLKRAWTAFLDYQKYLGRGTLSDLQKAKAALTRVIGLVRTNTSVAMRVKTLTGLDLVQLEIMLEQLKTQIRQMARGGGGGAGGGGAGRGGGGGPQRP